MTWPAKRTKLAQKAPYHKMVHICYVYNVYILQAVKCCLLNCSLMVKSSLQWLQHIFSYDTTNLKNVVKFYVPPWSIFAGPVTYAMLYVNAEAIIP